MATIYQLGLVGKRLAIRMFYKNIKLNNGAGEILVGLF
jgi:hypothetical protein